jgi:hypothetical protein
MDIEITKVYDDDGFNLAHISARNNDHRTLDVLIHYSFQYWAKYNNVTKSMSLDLLQEWVNERPKPPILLLSNVANGS